MNRRLRTLLPSLLLCTALLAQTPSPTDSLSRKMAWFGDARLGIFIHWGIYAVDGVDESWSFHNRKIGWQEYMAQLKGFTASRYDPAAWASLIRESGARYAVVTTKHHDGVALWDSRQRHYDVVDNTPAGRDLLTPFFSALRKEGVKAGAYFSLIDWSHPDYPGFLKDSGRYRIADQPERWARFRNFMQAQIAEVGDRFNPDLWWFDGDWEHHAAEWGAPDIRAGILRRNADAVINARLAGHGDYATPEQNLPLQRPAQRWWELCMTINDNWGFQHRDTNWKTPSEIIAIYADVLGNGGNLLLDIGPREDGTIPDRQVHVLRELGAWNRKHAEAVYGTRAGMPSGHFYGPSTLSADSTTLYLFLPGRTSGEVLVKGLVNRIRSVSVLGEGTALSHKVVGKISWSPVPGLVYITVPESVRQDRHITVLKVSLEGPLRLHKGH